MYIRDDKSKKIDKLQVMERSSTDYYQKIKVKSLKLFPGQEFLFVSMDKGNSWLLLHKDPFTGKLYYSHRAPVYDFNFIT